MGGVGHSRLIIETMLVCRVIGNLHTVASVYWCVCGCWKVSVTWGCMLMEGHIVVDAGSVHSCCMGVKMLFGKLGE